MKHSIPIRETNRAFVGNFATTTPQRAEARSPSWTVLHGFIVDSNRSKLGIEKRCHSQAILGGVWLVDYIFVNLIVHSSCFS